MSLFWRTWFAWSRWWSLTPEEKLFIAAGRNRLAEVETMVGFLNQRMKSLDDGWDNLTPLMIACQQGHADVVELLLRAGANPNLQTPEKLTPLRLALQNGYYLVVQLLLQYSAQITPDLIGPVIRPTLKPPTRLYQDTDGYWTSLPSSAEQDIGLCLAALFQAGLRIASDDMECILTSPSLFQLIASVLTSEQLFDLIPVSFLRTKFQFREYLRRGFSIDLGLPHHPPLSLFCFFLGQGLVCPFEVEQDYHRLALAVHGGQVSRDGLPQGALVSFMEDLAQHKLELISLDEIGNNRLGQIVLHTTATPEEKIIVLEMLLTREMDASHENRRGETALQLVQQTGQDQLLDVFL